jgi:hypothetical protein
VHVFEGICEGCSVALLGPNLGLDGDDLSASPSDLFTAGGKTPRYQLNSSLCESVWEHSRSERFGGGF